MTYEEAIERLKKRICNEGVTRADKTYHFCTDECMHGEEYCKIALAIKALEKQIPMKVIEHKGAFVSGYKAAKCRNCNHGVISFDVFCSHCGQRLDWGEEG